MESLRRSHVATNTKAVAPIAGTQIETVAGFWRDLNESAGENQVTLLRRVEEQLGQIRERFHETLRAAASGTQNLMNALETMISSASSAYELTARTASEALKLAEARVEAVSAGIRTQQPREQRKSA